MTKEEKLDKVTKDFSLLPNEKQDYILGVLQALAFAHDTTNEQIEIGPPDSEQNHKIVEKNSQKGMFHDEKEKR
jgi:hypothetical protein